MDFSSANVPIARDTWAPKSPPRQPAPPLPTSSHYPPNPYASYPPVAAPALPPPPPAPPTFILDPKQQDNLYRPPSAVAIQPRNPNYPNQADLYRPPPDSPPPPPARPVPSNGTGQGSYGDTRAPLGGDAAPRKPVQAPRVGANPVLGVFGLSIRTRERDLEDEFTRYGDVEKVVIVYDQRTDRSRGFGFITMRNTDDAARCVDKLNGFSLHGRQIRVDFSATAKPHNPTPGEYMGIKRPIPEEPRGGRGPGDRYEDRRDDRRRYDDRRDDRRDDRDRDRDRDRRERDSVSRRDVDDPYGGRSRRDDRDRRRSPSPRRRHSASPDRRVRDYDAPPPAQAAAPQEPPRY